MKKERRQDRRNPFPLLFAAVTLKSAYQHSIAFVSDYPLRQVFSKEQRQKRNYLIHLLYVRKEFDECLLLIEDTLALVNQIAEYPLFVKALICRHRGNITESLSLFQKALRLNPYNVENMKQVGRSLFLLGKHKAALDFLDEALRMGHEDDWEIWHNKGLCLAYLRKFEDAKEAFQHANSIQRHDTTFIQLGQTLAQEEDYKVFVFQGLS
jgi:Bardet-Biedl syndrome 4 protein